MRSLERISRPVAAFTLLELLVVTFIMAAAASLTVPNFARFFGNIEFHRTAEDLVSVIRFGQLRALTYGRWVRVKMNSTGYWLEEERLSDDIVLTGFSEQYFESLKSRHGRVVKWPRGIGLRQDQAVVLFSPDGRVRSSEIEICRGQECVIIAASWVIGHVKLIKLKEERTDV